MNTHLQFLTSKTSCVNQSIWKLGFNHGTLISAVRLFDTSEYTFQPANDETKELYNVFKSALDSGDKAQLQAVLDELNVKAMLEARQGGGVFGGRETKGQQDNGGKKKSSKKKKKSLRDDQKKVLQPF